MTACFLFQTISSIPLSIPLSYLFDSSMPFFLLFCDRETTFPFINGDFPLQFASVTFHPNKTLANSR